MNYTSTNDKQLWKVSNDDVTIPIFCTPVEDISGNAFWIITAAVYLHYGIHPTLSLALQPLSVINERDRWIVPADKLSSVATKCEGITPGYYFHGVEEPPKSEEFSAEENPTPPEFDEEFVREVWHRSQVSKLSVFKVIWGALIQGIAHRLLVDNKPLDLGWFTIHALPYRENWKHNLLFKHPKLHTYYNGMSASIRQAMMKRDGVYADLLRTDMIALKTKEGRATFRWSLEIEQSPQWLKYVDQVEHDRLTGATTTAYIHRWGTIVKRSTHIINVLLTQFIKQISTPAAKPIESGDSGRKRLVPYTPSGGSRKIIVDRVDRDLVLDIEDSAIRGPEGSDTEKPAPRKMPELPIVRLDSFRVRPSGGSVAGRTGEAADARLPLSSQDSCDGPSEALLD
jgi:hypothetical protein